MSGLSLRTLLMLFAALAGAKVWAQDRYNRTIFHDALLTAYEDQARARCQKELTRTGQARGAAHLTAREVTIGSPYADVAMWDLDNPLWDVRFRHPHILLSSEGMNGARCVYDLTAGIASLAADP